MLPPSTVEVSFSSITGDRLASFGSEENSKLGVSGMASKTSFAIEQVWAILGETGVETRQRLRSAHPLRRQRATGVDLGGDGPGFVGVGERGVEADAGGERSDRGELVGEYTSKLPGVDAQRSLRHEGDSQTYMLGRKPAEVLRLSHSARRASSVFLISLSITSFRISVTRFPRPGSSWNPIMGTAFGGK